MSDEQVGEITITNIEEHDGDDRCMNWLPEHGTPCQNKADWREEHEEIKDFLICDDCMPASAIEQFQ